MKRIRHKIMWVGIFIFLVCLQLSSFFVAYAEEYNLPFNGDFSWSRMLNARTLGNITENSSSIFINGPGEVYYESPFRIDEINMNVKRNNTQTAPTKILFCRNRRTHGEKISTSIGYMLWIRTNGHIMLQKSQTLDKPWIIENKDFEQFSTGVDFTNGKDIKIKILRDSLNNKNTIILTIHGIDYTWIDDNTKLTDTGYIGFLSEGSDFGISNVKVVGDIATDNTILKPVYLLRSESVDNSVTLRWKYNTFTAVKGVNIYKGSNLIKQVLYPNSEVTFYETDSSKKITYQVKVVGRNGIEETTGKSIEVELGVQEIKVEKKEELQRIVVEKGIQGVSPAKFVYKNNNKEFIYNGVNLVRLFGDHSTFAPGQYDIDEVEYELKLLNKYGYNVVRVFINGRYPEFKGIQGSSMTPQLVNGLDVEYMNNVLDFMRRATSYGIYVMPAMSDIPANTYYTSIRGTDPNIGGRNRYIMTQSGINAKKEFIERFLKWIKDKEPKLMNTIFSLEIENEECYDPRSMPFTLTTGMVTTADGNTYDMSNAESIEEMKHNNAINYINQIVALVKSIDSDMMVSISPILNTHAHIMGLSNRYLEYQVESNLDFVDMHFYIWTEHDTEDKMKLRVDQDFEKFRALPYTYTDKPFIIGEYGAIKPSSKLNNTQLYDLIFKLREYMYQKGIRGFNYWTLDTEEQDWDGSNIVHMSKNNFALAEKLGGNYVQGKNVIIESRITRDGKVHTSGKVINNFSIADNVDIKQAYYDINNKQLIEYEETNAKSMGSDIQLFSLGLFSLKSTDYYSKVFLWKGMEPIQKNLVFKDTLSWKPYMLGDKLSLWLDAMDNSTLERTDQNISAWKDKSDKGNHVSQSTSLKQPLYFGQGLEDRPTVTFDSSKLQFLSVGGYVDNLDTQDASIFIVGKRGEGSSDFTICGNRNYGLGGRIIRTKSTPSIQVVNVGGGTIFPFNADITSSFLLSGVFSVTDKKIYANINGGSLNIQTITDYKSVTAPFHIGAGGITNQEYFNGNISELVYVGRALTNEERQKMEGYLAWKWGMQDKLPTDHPYKNDGSIFGY